MSRGKRSASLARGKRSVSLFSDPCFQLSLVQKKVSHKGLESAQGLAGKSLGVGYVHGQGYPVIREKLHQD